MTTSISNEPLYIQLAQQLISRIHSGVWQVGSKLPAEHQLAETFGVSRTTVRKALSKLEQMGRVYKVRSRGTYVRQPFFKQSVNHLTGFTEDVTKLGRVAGHRLLVADEVEASTEVAAVLGVEPTTDCYYLHRLLLADDLPFFHAKTFLPKRYFELRGVSVTRDLGGGSLYEYLESNDIQLSKANITISADQADSEDIHLLGCPKRDPVLVSKRVVHDPNQVPVEYTIARAHYERHQWELVSWRKGGDWNQK